jgi:hypothetical protein
LNTLAATFDSRQVIAPILDARRGDSIPDTYVGDALLRLENSFWTRLASQLFLPSHHKAALSVAQNRHISEPRNSVIRHDHDATSCAEVAIASTDEGISW